MEAWISELIPDDDDLYYRIHKTFIKSTKIFKSGFRSRNGSMSTDWSRYSSPEESRERAKKPKENFIVKLNAGALREIPMDVEHSPSIKFDNRSHTDVYGLEGLDPDDRNELRTKLKTISDWVIPPNI